MKTEDVKVGSEYVTKVGGGNRKVVVLSGPHTLQDGRGRRPFFRVARVATGREMMRKASALHPLPPKKTPADDGMAAVREDVAREAPAPLRIVAPKFPLGSLVATPGVLAAVATARWAECLQAHATGNWGETFPEDRKANDAALLGGQDRIISAYTIDPSQKSTDERRLPVFWIITEADRSTTTILLPEEY